MSNTYDTNWSNPASDLVELGTPVLTCPRAEDWSCHQLPAMVVPALVGSPPTSYQTWLNFPHLNLIEKNYLELALDTSEKKK